MGRKTELLIDRVIMNKKQTEFLKVLKSKKYLDHNTMRQEGFSGFDTTFLELMGLIILKESKDPSWTITEKGIQFLSLWDDFLLSLITLED